MKRVVLTIIALAIIAPVLANTLIQMTAEGTNQVLLLDKGGYVFQMSYTNSTSDVEIPIPPSARPQIDARPPRGPPERVKEQFQERMKQRLIQKSENAPVDVIIVNRAEAPLLRPNAVAQGVSARKMTRSEIEALPPTVEVYENEVVRSMLLEVDEIINYTLAEATFGYSGSRNVCIVDTGIDQNNPSFTIGAQFDFVDNDSIAEDFHLHGTRMATAITHYAPNATLYIAKVLNTSGVGLTSNVIDGINWCVSQNVDIISLSLGAEGYPSMCDVSILAQTANQAASSGIFVSAAAGNGGPGAMLTPACASNVTGVGATKKSPEDVIWQLSGLTNATSVLAPGESITVAGHTLHGTSISTAIVSGVAAQLMDAGVLVEQIDSRLQQTGTPVLVNGQYYPVVDVYAAIINNTHNISMAKDVYQATEAIDSQFVTAQLGESCTSDAQCGADICVNNYLEGYSEGGRCVPDLSYCVSDNANSSGGNIFEQDVNLSAGGETHTCYGDNFGHSAWIVEDGWLEIRNSGGSLRAVLDKYGSFAIRDNFAGEETSQSNYGSGWQIINSSTGNIIFEINESGWLRTYGSVTGGPFTGIVDQTTDPGGSDSFRVVNESTGAWLMTVQSDGDIYLRSDFAQDFVGSELWTR